MDEGLVLYQRAHECQNDDILLSLEIKAKTILLSHPDCLFDCSFRQWGLAKPTDRSPLLLVLWLIPFQDLEDMTFSHADEAGVSLSSSFTRRHAFS